MVSGTEREDPETATIFPSNSSAGSVKSAGWVLVTGWESGMPAELKILEYLTSIILHFARKCLQFNLLHLDSLYIESRLLT